MRFKVEFIRTAFEPIGLVGISMVTADTVDAALSWAWDAYNRGSGSEVPFAGPSASVDDIFRVQNVEGHPGIFELYVIAPVGFKRVDRYAPEGGR
jgi:hypothetical protein